MSRKVQLKANVRLLSSNFQDSRCSYNKSIDSTIIGKDTQFTLSQIHFQPNNNSYIQCQELKQADQKQECSILQNTSKKVSNQDLHKKILKINQHEQKQHFYLTNDEAKVIQYSQKLRNLHVFYNVLIRNERQNNLEKNQTVMYVIDIMEKNHTKRIQDYKQKYQLLKMNTTIKRKNQLQQERDSLKKLNEQLINQKIKQKIRISEKQKLLQQLRRQKYELLAEGQKIAQQKQKKQKTNKETYSLIKKYGF